MVNKIKGVVKKKTLFENCFAGSKFILAVKWMSGLFVELVAVFNFIIGNFVFNWK